MLQNQTRMITIKISGQLVKLIDFIVYELGLYGSRSEFIREAIRQHVQRILESNKELLDKLPENQSLKKLLQEI
ncbi:MAG: ribbon-helix-helix domain-containing protein [Crenarchaeota archaeon]|nr:ribbon-helix-helix domain-containing protein [Thermoproteota archaeon]MCR8454480.1 ribbon-helix-helix domain-containing protein [Thermoproteota archaeon]MCR8455095.1 ribbon-helix-helix domain-containing protein [Thermoproteota archaeon]MCR8462809.1 ribbon-helix-helix domain-containing protein [Thermoproteota archaeon]MCR8471364.1 ribbon-helix-helix domain-containing protein [Thermoproteota archaeon]